MTQDFLFLFSHLPHSAAANQTPLPLIAELSQPLWLVASKHSDPRLIAQLRRSLDKLKANGRWQALQQTCQLDAAAKLPN